MTALQMIVSVLAVLVVFFAALVVTVFLRRWRLRHRFGPEYGYVVHHSGSREEAESELRDRQRRHSLLSLNDLEPERRDAYAQRWVHLQEQFVEAPRAAVEAADELASQIAVERGYPEGDLRERLALLSVNHATAVVAARRAHEVLDSAARRRAATEELRQAMVGYRTFIAELLGEPESGELADNTTLRRIHDR